MTALMEMDENDDTEPRCVYCNAGWLTEFHAMTCPFAADDADDLAAEDDDET